MDIMKAVEAEKKARAAVHGVVVESSGAQVDQDLLAALKAGFGLDGALR